MMDCPKCSAPYSIKMSERYSAVDGMTHRKRLCPMCRAEWQTQEIVTSMIRKPRQAAFEASWLEAQTQRGKTNG